MTVIQSQVMPSTRCIALSVPEMLLHIQSSKKERLVAPSFNYMTNPQLSPLHLFHVSPAVVGQVCVIVLSPTVR